MDALYRRRYDADALMREHPLEIGHPNKKLVYELGLGSRLVGTIDVTRWPAMLLPTQLQLADTTLTPLSGYFDYAGSDRGVWHVNFADPELFFAYGSSLLAQDELQCAEHPALGAVREALVGEKLAALTEEAGQPTPVLVAGVERRIAIDTAPSASRPNGLYGNHFARADAQTVREATRVQSPAPLSNILAIAAPVGGGAYTRAQLEYVLVTAYTGFRAAALETNRLWPGAHTEIRTGFWGCGAFGGNRELMTMLQLIAARIAGVDELKFYAFDDAGRADYNAGVSAMESVLGFDDSTTYDLVTRISERGYQWGQSNGT